MKESAIAQLLQNCDITEAMLVINIQTANGDKKEITLKDSEDFMNDVVKKAPSSIWCSPTGRSTPASSTPSKMRMENMFSTSKRDPVLLLAYACRIANSWATISTRLYDR